MGLGPFLSSTEFKLLSWESWTSAVQMITKILGMFVFTYKQLVEGSNKLIIKPIF